MNPTQAIEQARKEMLELLKQGTSDNFRRYVWQPPELQQRRGQLPEQGDPWQVHGYGPGDVRPYYVVTVTGRVVDGVVKAQDTVEIFNRPDYARATIWDRIAASEPPSSE